MVKKSRLIPNWFQLLMASLLAKPPLDGGALLSLHALLLHFKTFFLVSLEFPESRLNVITASVWETVAKRVQIRSCRRSCKHKDLHDCFQWQTEINHLQSLSEAPRPLVQTSTRAVSSHLGSERAGRAAIKQRNYTRTNSFFIF